MNRITLVLWVLISLTFNVSYPQYANNQHVKSVMSDFDGDGISDNQDLDADNDGIPNMDECNGVDPYTDNDHDGVYLYLDDDDSDFNVKDDRGDIEDGFDYDNDGEPNFLDLDADNDGLWDAAESGRIAGDDTNFDGVLENSVGANGLVDILENPADSGNLTYTIRDNDGDGNPDFIDTDDDNDNVPTTEEEPDPNGNGYPDDALDTDAGGSGNYLDPDDDGDGIDTIWEDVALPNNFPQDGDPTNDDTDLDGIPNYLDADDDNDGTPTVDESPDDDNDGQPDDALDSDGDGTPDYLDPVNDPFDHDNDGVNDADDIDDDNDGIPDTEELDGKDPLEDLDGDGVFAYLDDNDNDSNVGDDNHHVEAAYDLDLDNIPNHFDLDADNDGLFDFAESGHTAISDSNHDGMVDSAVGVNGLADDLETFADNGVLNYTIQDSDGDTIYDFLDVDDDNDHVYTKDEYADINGDNYPDDAVDVDMDGIPNYLDPDDDGDGLYTIYEDVILPNNYPQDGDPTNDDTDLDGIPNYLDVDDDNDGILTINEHADDNGNHEPEDAIDEDGDGIPNYLDKYENPDDHDNDQINDDVDIDDDNDGIPDLKEYTSGLNPDDDADGDGVPAYKDDDDNDSNVGDTDGLAQPAFDLDGDGQSL